MPTPSKPTERPEAGEVSILRHHAPQISDLFQIDQGGLVALAVAEKERLLTRQIEDGTSQMRILDAEISRSTTKRDQQYDEWLEQAGMPARARLYAAMKPLGYTPHGSAPKAETEKSLAELIRLVRNNSQVSVGFSMTPTFTLPGGAQGLTFDMPYRWELVGMPGQILTTQKNIDEMVATHENLAKGVMDSRRQLQNIDSIERQAHAALARHALSQHPQGPAILDSVAKYMTINPARLIETSGDTSRESNG